MKSKIISSLLLSTLCISFHAQAFDLKFMHKHKMVSLENEYFSFNRSAMRSFLGHFESQDSFETEDICIETNNDLQTAPEDLMELASGWSNMIFTNNALDAETDNSGQILLTMSHKTQNFIIGNVLVDHCHH